MGLDWNPLGKPQPGREKEFYSLLGQLTVPTAWLQPSPVVHTPIPPTESHDSIRRQMFSIQVSPYETTGAPRVGRDPAADDWIRAQYEHQPNKPASIEEWVRQFQGYYVLQLLPPNDGLPVYSNAPMGRPWEMWSFRAQFFNDCRDVMGDALLHEAWLHHTPDQLADYGTRLMACADVYATATGVSHVLQLRWFDSADSAKADDKTSPLHKAHVIASAARWAAYWSARGHGMEADY